MKENISKASPKTSPKTFLKGLASAAGILAAGIIGMVVLFDPFYHYHGPILGMPAILTDKEYQVVGSLRHFEYDAVLAGSSMIENNNNAWYDEAFGVKTIKAARSYGGVADLCWLLDEAFAAREGKILRGSEPSSETSIVATMSTEAEIETETGTETTSSAGNVQTGIRRVFFNVDATALIANPQTTFEASGCPMYLYDKNPFNDVKYLLNRDVLFEKIPYMLAQAASGFEEGNSYNWAEGKDFSQAGALAHYYRQKEPAPMNPADTYADNVAANMKLLQNLVEAHPETQFSFFLPPYASLWWDNAMRLGEYETYLYAEEQFMESLLPYENVRIFDYQNETEVTTDLGRFMDTIHFNPETNKQVCDWIAEGRDQVTSDNYQEILDKTRSLAESYQTGQIKELEEAQSFIYQQ